MNKNELVYATLTKQNIELYAWHPLAKYVNTVIYSYNSEADITLSNYLFFAFEEKLEYICNKNSKYDYLRKIFEPLDIITYKDKTGNIFYLFRYKNYIKLSEIGYNIDNFFELYNNLYLECRSVVFDSYGRLVLASMPKFKNYGEDDKNWSKKSCSNKYNLSSKYFITDKMDGSYVQFSYDIFYDRIIGSTSKNLNPSDNEVGWRLQAAYEMLDENYKKMIKHFPDYTFHFEFIHSKNPIVVYYPKEKQGLYLISARNKYTGIEYDFSRLEAIVNYFNVKIIKCYKYEKLFSILGQVGDYSANDKEGWVVNCIDKKGNSFRFKVKTDDYVLMHKTLSNIISSNVIIQAIAEEKYDDFYSKVPDAHKKNINGIYLEIIEYKKNISVAIEKALDIIPESFKKNEKDYALYVTKSFPSFLHKYLFMERKGIKYNIFKKQGIGHKKLQELKEESEKAVLFIEIKKAEEKYDKNNK